MKNSELKGEIVGKGLCYRQVAEAMGVKTNTLAHYLMGDLSAVKRQRIIDAIAKASLKGDLQNGKKEKTRMV